MEDVSIPLVSYEISEEEEIETIVAKLNVKIKLRKENLII